MSIRSVYPLTLVMTSILLVSGCMSYRYVPTEGEVLPETGSVSLPVAFQAAPATVTSKTQMVKSPEWTKITSAIENSMESQIQGLSADASPSQSANLAVSMENSTIKMNWGHFLMYIGSLFTLPSSSDIEFDSELSVATGGETLFTSQANGKIRSYISVYSPSALFVGKKDPAIASEDLSNDMMRRHLQALEKWVTAEKHQYDQEVAGKDILEQRQWLIDNPRSLFAGDILGNLASHTPRGNALDWHRENVALFPGYAAMLPEEDALWFIGPEDLRVIDLVDAIKKGTSQTVLAARTETQGPYKSFDDEETRRLRRMGLSSDLIASMIRSTSRTPPPAMAATRNSQSDNVTAALLIPDNSGEYMNPWTSDGVLAEWVDKAINANMGSAIGSTVGAYAGQKALENVPFIGGILGSKLGKEVGRTTAINSSGGMDYIRTTSDLSFRNLDDMARYLKTHYANESTYQDAIKAADAIYPGLMKSLASAQ